MIEVQQLTGPFGIPILYQRMPDVVKSAAISWTVFTGSADDESVGKPGLYHWLEHSPFRGTKKYPGGYADTKGWATKYNGYVNAWTNEYRTRYEAHVPLDAWQKAFSVLTDLISQPLLRDEDILAEHKVILNEINGNLGNITNIVGMKLPEMIYKGHPLGHAIIGSRETLSLMNPETVRQAYTTGYDRSRLILTVIGNIPFESLMSEIAHLAEILPNHGLSERRIPAHHGPLPPWKCNVREEVDIDNSSSATLMLFPLPTSNNLDVFSTTELITELFEFGMLSSPLFRILREERKLVYHTYTMCDYETHRAHMGFFATSQKSNIDKVVEAFVDVMRDESVLSRERISEVQRGIEYRNFMRPFDPLSYMQTALNRHLNAHQIVNDLDLVQTFKNRSDEELRNLLQQIDSESAHTIIFRGKD